MEGESSTKPQTPKHLTPAYMAERRSKGLCYFCDEPFTPEHDLIHTRLQIHVLEIEDEEEGSGPQEPDANMVSEHDSEPLISVNALTGVANF